ncbi:hypothetical protein ACFQ0T_08260 [Kitasatospora gansuensis]
MVPIASAETLVGPYKYTDKLWAADPLPDLPKVQGHNADGSGKALDSSVPVGARELRSHKVEAAKWPAASTRTVKPGVAQASSGPVTVAPATADARTKAAAGGSPQGDPSSVKVETVDHAKAQAANVDGLLVGLTQQDGQDPGAVAVSIDYGSFAQAYGGGWASRLHLVQMPRAR